MNNKGSITVSLSISLLVVICFMFIILEGARIKVARSESKLRLSIATESLMAEYDPNIYKNYHIFVFDRGYGEKEVNLNKIKSNITNYYNTYLDYESNTEEFIELILEDLKFNFNKNMCNTKEFKYQACQYMKYNISDDRVFELKNMLNSNNNSYDNVLWIEYLLKHFKSYIDRDKVDTVNRKKIYELEYIVFGCNNDNDNFEKSINSIKKKKVSLSKNNYEKNIVSLLCCVDEDVMCKRVVDLIIQNTNNNYHTNIMKYNCFFGINIESVSSMEAKVLVWKLANAAINNIDRYEYKDTRTYFY